MKFKPTTDKKLTENKTIRFPLELVHEIENIIRDKDITFSGFIIQAARFGIENLDEDFLND